MPKDRIADYQTIAEAASQTWSEHGALEYRGCVGDVLKTQGTGSFAEMVNANDDDTIIFARAVFESRQT